MIPPRRRTTSPVYSREAGLRLEKSISGAAPAETAVRPRGPTFRAVRPSDETGRIDKSPPAGSAASDRAEVEHRKGTELKRQNRIVEAASHFSAALREDPTHVPARNGLVALLAENGRLTEAEEVLRQGIGHQPVHLPWVVSLSRLRMEQSDAAGAWEILQKHALAGISSADFQGLAGIVLQKLGRMKEAGGRYQAAVRLDPENPRWWVGLGLAMETEGRPELARDAYQKARSLPGLSKELTTFVEQRLR